MENNEIRVYTPNEDAFKVTKVKMTKEGGLDVHYEETEQIGNQTYVNKKHVECGKDIHPDMRAAFKALKPIIMRVFNMCSYATLVKDAEYKATPEQIAKAEELAKMQSAGIHITGLSISGADNNVGYVITGKIETSALQTAAINTPRIRVADELYGIEDELGVCADDIESEVYAYLFRGKKAQLELFGANGEPNAGDE